jgi:hypothetical protein
MGRARVRRLFRAILSNRKPTWKFNMSPLFLEFLMGDRNYECIPWGMPTYNIFGWQKPCYLLQDGYAESYQELLETTKWEEYGVPSGNPQCANCMVSCGYETPAVIEGFTTWKGFMGMVRGNFGKYRSASALKLLSEAAPHGNATLVKIAAVAKKPALEETHA